MSLPRPSLQTFMTSAKALLSSANTTTSLQTPSLTFVLGNEAADLDSLCSAVLLAYLRTYFPVNSAILKHTSNQKRHTFYIPLSNLSRQDLSLRPELHPVLSRANLNTGDLLTLCDLPKSLTANRTRWVLVDHNSMTGELGDKYGARVVGVVDHHADEGNELLEEDGQESEGKVVRTVGSCASLVVEEWQRRRNPTSAAVDQNPAWEEQLAALALGPIVIDTTNLTAKEKTTDADVAAVKFLDGMLKQSGELGKNFDRKAYFEELKQAQEDIGRLSLYDILRKDYKQWSDGDGSVKLGISSVVRDISFLIDKAGGEGKFVDELERFAVERGLSIVSVMTTLHHPEKGFARELLVWGLDKNGIQASTKFEGVSKDKLGLASWNEGILNLEGDKGWRRCWWQERVENSRKQVAPLLRAAISQ